MKLELDSKLCTQFPIIYRKRHWNPQETCMSWGFECNDGWYDIIYEASEKLEKIAENQPAPKKWHPLKKTIWPLINEFSKYLRKKNLKRNTFYYHFLWSIVVYFDEPEDERLAIEQVKQKFGQLRIYVNYTSDEIMKIIEKAEIKSGKICDNCGTAGKTQSINGWYLTRCESCYKILLSMKNK